MGEGQWILLRGEGLCCHLDGRPSGPAITRDWELAVGAIEAHEDTPRSDRPRDWNRTLLGYHCLAMESHRVLNIEKRVGIALFMANCIRLRFWRRSLESVAIVGDILAMLGGSLSIFMGSICSAKKTQTSPCSTFWKNHPNLQNPILGFCKCFDLGIYTARSRGASQIEADTEI